MGQENGAGDEIRTHDFNIGKVVSPCLNQLIIADNEDVSGGVPDQPPLIGPFLLLVH